MVCFVCFLPEIWTWCRRSIKETTGKNWLKHFQSTVKVNLLVVSLQVDTNQSTENCRRNHSGCLCCCYHGRDPCARHSWGTCVRVYAIKNTNRHPAAPNTLPEISSNFFNIHPEDVRLFWDVDVAANIFFSRMIGFRMALELKVMYRTDYYRFFFT